MGCDGVLAQLEPMAPRCNLQTARKYEVAVEVFFEASQGGDKRAESRTSVDKDEHFMGLMERLHQEVKVELIRWQEKASNLSEVPKEVPSDLLMSSHRGDPASPRSPVASFGHPRRSGDSRITAATRATSTTPRESKIRDLGPACA